MVDGHINLLRLDIHIHLLWLGTQKWLTGTLHHALVVSGFLFIGKP